MVEQQISPAVSPFRIRDKNLCLSEQSRCHVVEQILGNPLTIRVISRSEPVTIKTGAPVRRCKNVTF